jgi:hypothetical protein
MAVSALNITIEENDDSAWTSGGLVGAFGFSVVFCCAFGLLICFIKNSGEHDDETKGTDGFRVKANLVRVYTVESDDIQSIPPNQATMSSGSDMKNDLRIREMRASTLPSLEQQHADRDTPPRLLRKAKTCLMDAHVGLTTTRHSRIGLSAHATAYPSLDEKAQSACTLEDLEVLERRLAVPIVKSADAKAEVIALLKRSLKDNISSRRKTFKFLCAKWHPDKHCLPNVETATEMFQYVQEQKSWYLDA